MASVANASPRVASSADYPDLQPVVKRNPLQHCNTIARPITPNDATVPTDPTDPTASSDSTLLNGVGLAVVLQAVYIAVVLAPSSECKSAQR